MELKNNWEAIRHLLEKAFESCGHYAVASVSEDGTPNAAPIGSLCLQDDYTGFYFEVFSSQTAKNLEHNPRICVVISNGGLFSFWIKSLFLGKFLTPTGVKLYGTVIGKKRLATEEEIQIFRKRIHKFRLFKGYKLLWRDFKYVRDVKFERCEPLNLGVMGHSSWKQR